MQFPKIKSILHKLAVVAFTAILTSETSHYYERIMRESCNNFLKMVFFGFLLPVNHIMLMKLNRLFMSYLGRDQLMVDLRLRTDGRCDNRIITYDLRSTLGLKFNIKNREVSFNAEDVIKSIKLARKIPLQYQYDNCFLGVIKKCSKHFNDKILDDLSSHSDEHFANTLHQLSDYGFLSSIGRARVKNQTITLYTGSAHSKNIFKELKEFGYEVLFLKENDSETPLSKEDCEKLFSVQPEKKGNSPGDLIFDY